MMSTHNLHRSSVRVPIGSTAGKPMRRRRIKIVATSDPETSICQMPTSLCCYCAVLVLPSSANRFLERRQAADRLGCGGQSSKTVIVMKRRIPTMVATTTPNKQQGPFRLKSLQQQAQPRPHRRVKLDAVSARQPSARRANTILSLSSFLPTYLPLHSSCPQLRSLTSKRNP